MGLDFKSLDGFIHQPVFIFKPSLGISGFFGIIDTGIKIIACSTVFFGSCGAEFLSAGFICIDGNDPSFQRFTCVGTLMEPAKALFPIQPFIHNRFTSFHRNVMEAQFAIPVVILRRQLHHSVTAQREVSCAGITVFIGGVVTDDIAVHVPDTESPAVKVVARIGGLSELNASEVGIGESHSGRLIHSHGNSFDSGIIFPIGISGVHLFGIIGSGL